MSLSRASTLSKTPFIPLSAPEIRGNEWDYVKQCLDTGWVSSAGDFVRRFESQMADRIGVPFAVAVSSGTAALHVALRVAGVEAGDEVVVPSLTFVATANAVRYLGAWPVFVDVDPVYRQMDAEKVSHFLKAYCRREDGGLIDAETGRRVRAILPVDALGHPVDMDPLMSIAREYGIALIEDATESLGSLYKERPAGALADFACFSFNGNKILTTGGGGMIVTRNAEFAARAKHLSTQAKSDSVEYIHDDVGYNYRLSNIQAALGCAQLEMLDEFVSAKRAIAVKYDRAFSGIKGLSVPAEAPWAKSNFWLYTIMVDPGDFGADRKQIMRICADAGIETRPVWQPLHLSPAHRGCRACACDAAERIYEAALSLPSSTGLGAEDQERVIDVVRSAGRRSAG